MCVFDYICAVSTYGCVCDCALFSYIHTSPHFSLVLESPDAQRRVPRPTSGGESFCAAAVAATAVSTVTRLVLVRRNVAAQIYEPLRTLTHPHIRTIQHARRQQRIELAALATIIAGYSIQVNCVWSVQK